MSLVQKRQINVRVIVRTERRVVRGVVTIQVVPVKAV